MEDSSYIHHNWLLLYRYVPEIIEGDMDSIRPEVKLFYSNQVPLLEFSFLHCLSGHPS
jgi:hypothetical protein